MQIRCPYCGSRDTARILRGLPVYSEKLKQDLDQGKVILGGCFVNGTDPMYQCNDCKKKFGKEPVCSIRGKQYRPQDISGIEFSVGGYFGGYDYVVIRNEETSRAVCVQHYPDSDDRMLYIRAFTKSEWESLQKVLFDELFVHEWKRSYIDPSIMDGTQWSFTLVFNDGKKREITGSNKYPALWEPFNRRFEKLIKEAQDKDANPADVYRFRNLFREYGPIREWIRGHLAMLFNGIFASEKTRKQYDRYMSWNTDKDLRRNHKHVHHSYLFHCDHCGLEDDIYIGSGFSAPMVYDETVEKIKSGTYGENWKELFESHPKTLVNIELTLYVCSACGHYESEHNLGLYVLKDGLTEEEIKLAGQNPDEEDARYVYLYNMMWSLQYYRKIGSFVHRCPECGKRMHEGGYRDKPRCPKCGKRGKIETGRILWD